MAEKTDARAAGESTADKKASRRLRVLLVNQYYATTDAPTAKLLAEVGTALAEEGHEVSAICSQRGYRNTSFRFPKFEVVDGVSVHRMAGSGFTHRRRSGRIANYLTFFATAGRRLLTMEKPDVIVCLSTPPLLASIVQMIASLRGIRMVYWVMDVHPELAFRLGQIKPNSFTGRVLDRAARLPLGKADAVIALGDDMARHIRPYSNGNTRVVHTWANGDLIRPATQVDHPLRKEWGWDGKFIVAYSGTMGLVHEFDTILEAATQFNGDDRYLFCFIGDGARTNDLKAEVRRRNLANVEFRDYVPDDQLPQSLTAPNVHLVSLREDLAGLSVPSKTYGILAAGKPVAFIGPRDSEVATIVNSNGCGVHIENGDAAGLVRAIRNYRDSEEMLTAHGARARNVFEKAYTQSHGLKAIMALISG